MGSVMASNATLFRPSATISLGRVLFVSQRHAEMMRPPRNCALISITDPDTAPASLREGWTAVLRIAFDDIDPVSYPDDYDGLQEVSTEQAVKMADFCLVNALCCRRLVVHCRYGVSRSAAVAKALCEVTGLWFPKDYEDHNDLVYRTLRSAMQDAFHRADKPIRPNALGGE
jgi:predicted protein tyrosine phosphatase